MDANIVAPDPSAHIPDDVRLQPRILEYYHLAGPLMEASFGGDPIVYANFPHDFAGKPNFVPTDVPLSSSKLLWLIHRAYAVEFQGWAPLATDEDRLRFARILLTRTHHDKIGLIREGAERLRRQLHLDGLDAAPVLDGHNGIALWVPLADAPHGAVIRAWLHKFCDRAVADAPDLFTTEPLTHDPDRVHIHISSNARGRHSALPYSLRGDTSLTVVTPVTWYGVSMEAPPTMAGAFGAFLRDYGDVFAKEVKRIGDQRLPAAPRPFLIVPDFESLDSATRGHVITATIAILEDGKARTADEILTEALTRKLVPPTTTKKYIYSALIEYIARWLGRGRKPQIIQDNERKFRINEPPDDWPNVTPSAAAGGRGVEGQPGQGNEAASDEQIAIDAIVARLHSTSTGDDPAKFEIACCDTFAHLGFLTQHVGGHENPDGIADAILGPLAYRLMLECKTAPVHRPYHPHATGKSADAGGVVERPNVAEAAKFVDAFGADYAALIAPDYGNDLETLSELQTHKVAAFTVSDLATLLHIGANALEIRTVLDEPGFAMERVADLVWERRHGRVKRIATVAALIQREGWAAQRTAADQHAGLATPSVSNGAGANGNGRLARGDAPRLTVDAAMMLVDAALRTAGSTQACTREEVEAAFTHLTDPLVASATWIDPSRDAIAVLTSGTATD